MKKGLLILFFSIFVSFCVFSPVLAQNSGGLQPSLKGEATNDLLGTTLKGAGLGSGTAFEFGQVLGSMVNVVISLIGVIILALSVYAGFLWMNARGNPDQVKKAQAIFAQVVVGGLIIGTSVLTVNLVAPATGQNVIGYEFAKGFLSSAGLLQGDASTLGGVLGLLVRVVFGLIGMIATVLYIYAGVMWFRSAGNPDTVKKARGIIIQTTIALIVILGAFSIVGYFLIQFGAIPSNPPSVESELLNESPGGGNLTPEELRQLENAQL